MNTITIQYTGQLANLFGTSEEQVQIDEGSVLIDLVRLIAGKHDQGGAEFLLSENEQIPTSLLVIFDGEQMEGEVKDLPLSEVNTVMFMTPIAGG